MDVINIVFRFFDFFVIIGLIIYGTRRHLIPMVEKLLREYGVFIYNLESDCKNLQLQTQSIYENIQDQDRQFQVMQKRFEMWQKKCEERLVLQQAEQQRTDDVMQNRFVVRSNVIKNDIAIKNQLPTILDAATKTLQGKYQGTSEQKQYIEKLIHVMKEQS
jgi:hypothetical protein